MRVLFLSTSGQLGGAERVLLEMVSACTTAGAEAGVVHFEEGPLDARVRRAGGETLLLPAPPALAALGEYGRGAVTTLARSALRVVPLAGFHRQLRRAARDWMPDVVHSNGVKTHLLSAHLGAAPVIWHVHDYVGQRSSASLLRLHARSAALVLTPSDDVAEDVQQALRRDSVATLHNGIDLTTYSPDGPVADLDGMSGLSPSADLVKVGLVATYARWKGHDTFLRALAALPSSVPVRGYIVGGPVYRSSGSQYTYEELADLVRQRGLTGRVGLVPFQEDVAPVYRALDIVVHASTAPEPFGLVVAEAMAAGRAVIAADAGGVREVVTTESALLHESGNARDLARAIEQLAASREQRYALGTAARERVTARFSRERFARSLLDAYGRVLGTHAGSHPVREAR